MKKALLSIFALSMVTAAMAMPANREPFRHIQSDGSSIVIYPHGDEYHHFFVNADGRQMVQDERGDFVMAEEQQTRQQLQARHRMGVQRRVKQEFGKEPFLAPHGLVILAEFSDQKFLNTDQLADFQDMMNGESYTYNNATGSVHQYFSDQSNGQYKPTFSVIGPVTLPHDYAYYGQNDDYGYDMYLADFVIDAVLAADPLTDFSQIDYDNDGYVDFVYIIYAGYGEADSYKRNTIWPCNWELDATLASGYTNQETYYAVYNEKTNKYSSKNLPKLDGKFINSYACSSELRKNGTRAGIGGICHEYSHVMGLPDVYDPYYGSNDANSATPGSWHLMDQGCYNNGGKTPPGYSPWDKYFMGWVTPSLLNKPCNDTLPADGLTFRYISTDGKLKSATSPEPVWYLENRQQIGWDAFGPGHGLLVWMVKYDGNIWVANEPNASESETYGTPIANTTGELHYTLVPSNGKGTVSEDQSDPFPGSGNVRTFAPVETYPLTEISEDGGRITFQFMGGAPLTSVESPMVNASEIVGIYDLMGHWCGNDAASLTHGVYMVVDTQGAQKMFIP